jgi:hypothetical protein
MPNPTRIYLQPECCAEPDVGRLWCEHDEPVECEDGESWTEYVAVDEVLRMIDEGIASNVDLATMAYSYGDARTGEDARERLGALRELRTRFKGGTDA